MAVLKVGSLNINGGRAPARRAAVAELGRSKHLDVLFVQETHSSVDNQVAWGLDWGGQVVLSHGNNLSAGVGVLFSRHLHPTDVAASEPEPGRVQVVRATIRGSPFIFINVYAPTSGTERVAMFSRLSTLLRQLHGSGAVLVLGGDWNCTGDASRDRNSEEPHPSSASLLSRVVEENDLLDTWRELHPSARQYTWVRVSSGAVSAARLDRVYISRSARTLLSRASITPVGFSDHHLVGVELVSQVPPPRPAYWRFRVQLVQDQAFCSAFSLFWKQWRLERGGFGDLVQWWEVGKVQVRQFCLQFQTQSSTLASECVQELEQEVQQLERCLLRSPGSTSDAWRGGREALGRFVHAQAKSALVRSRLASLKDMDAPSRFFFGLEKKQRVQNVMTHLTLPDGSVTSDPATMRGLAVDFYSDLYGTADCDPGCLDRLLAGLPRLDESQSASLGVDLTLEELSTAVGQLSSGRAPGLDGLPAEFYKCFWDLLGEDLLEVLKCCLAQGRLPRSCTRAVLSLLPKKGDLGLLKNWRPISLLCSDYKILARCLSNRLKVFMDVVTHPSQTYCVPGRSIMDNIFLTRDIVDLSGHLDVDIGLLSIDQEKAFDRVGHAYLFGVLGGLGLGQGFISWVRLLYSGASVVLRVGGGLSRPVPVGRGIRQGCPLSGMLYALALEPLLHRLRARLPGFAFAEDAPRSPAVSAYADDLTVLITGQDDVDSLRSVLVQYERASSAKVNWAKSEGLLLGTWTNRTIPLLPGGLQWGREGIRTLGVFLGRGAFKEKNWEGLVERVRARLSRWAWVQPRLSYRGRALVANSLAASLLWHRFTALQPPDRLVLEIQRVLVDFFWGGFHWLRPSVLYLPVEEGGQGLVDIRSRLASLRLTTAQRFLCKEPHLWSDTASVLLRRVGGLRYDRHLFLLELRQVDLTATSPFYRSVLAAWRTVLKVRRGASPELDPVGEEPLFHNDLVRTRLLSSSAVQTAFIRAGVTKLRDLRTERGWTPAATLCRLTGFRSLRLMDRLLEEVRGGLPAPLRSARGAEQTGGPVLVPSLTISAAVGDHQEVVGALLSFSTPRLTELAGTTRTAFYRVAVKVLNRSQLAGLQESRWSGLLAAGSSPRGSWRSLYKPPTEKRTADLQWRVVHGAVATRRHVSRFSGDGRNCGFCPSEEESLYHLWLGCSRLAPLASLLRRCLRPLGHDLSNQLFVYGPRYSVARRGTVCLVNFLLGRAKLSVWLTRKNQMRGAGSTQLVPMFRGLVEARLRVEFVYYRLMGDLGGFQSVWGIGGALCRVDDNSLVFCF